MKSTAITIGGLLVALALVSCDSSATTPNPDQPPPADPQTGSASSSTSPAPATPAGGGTAVESEARKTVLPSGLAYFVLKEGQGTPPKIGSAVLIHCTGRLENGQVFWNTRTAGVPQRVVLTYDQLITGVLEALLTMKPGERRQLRIPSELAYGTEGYYKKVPPRADLDMDLELVSIEP